MRAYECDICGKLYTIDEFEKRKDDPSQQIEFRNKTCWGVTSINVGIKYNRLISHSCDFDICPECVNALNNFIKERKNINDNP